MSTQAKTISDFLNQTQEIVEKIQGTEHVKDIITIDDEIDKNTSLTNEDLRKIQQIIKEKIAFIILNKEDIIGIMIDIETIYVTLYWSDNNRDDFNQSVFNYFREICNKKTKQELLTIKKEVYSWNTGCRMLMSILESIIADKIKTNKHKETLDSLMEHRLLMNNLSDSYAIKTIDICIEEKVETSTDILKLKEYSQALYDIQANLSGSLKSGYYINDKIVRIMRNRIDTLSAIKIKEMNYSSIEEVLENAPTLTKNQLVSTESIAHEIKRILEEDLKHESLQVVFKTFKSINKKPANVWQYTGESEDYLKELMASKEFDNTACSSIEQMILIFKFLNKNKIHNKDFESKFKKEYRKEENTNIHRYTTIYFLSKKYNYPDEELKNKYKELVKEEGNILVLNKIIKISGMFKYLDYSIQRLCEKRVLELIDQKSQQEFKEIFAKCIENKYFYSNKNFFIEKAKGFGL